MLIKDLGFVEKISETEKINGGTSAFTGVSVSANGGRASADGFSYAFGDNTGASTLTGTRAASGSNFNLSAGTGAATGYAVTLDGKNSRVATSVSTGVATDVNVF